MRRNWNLKSELGSYGKLWGLKGATCVTGSSFRLDAIKVVDTKVSKLPCGLGPKTSLTPKL